MAHLHNYVAVPEGGIQEQNRFRTKQTGKVVFTMGYENNMKNLNG